MSPRTTLHLRKKILHNERPQDAAKTVNRTERKLNLAWRKNGWRPSGLLLMDGETLIFKTSVDLTVWQTHAETVPAISWRPKWHNKFLVDDATFVWSQMLDTYGQSEGERPPTGTKDIQLFGDQIAQGMSIHRGVLYSIEGIPYDALDGSLPRQPARPSFTWGSAPRRARTNRLCAYDLKTGQFLWRLPPHSDQADASHGLGLADTESTEQPLTLERTGFMAAPIGFGDRLISVVNQAGSLWLYAIDASNQGKVVWRIFLCDEPSSGSVAWAPIQVSLDGNNLYLVCGTGVVFSIDALSGAIQFAARYERTGNPSGLFERFGDDMGLFEWDGWSEDVVIPFENMLIVLASDNHTIFALDHQTGRRLWQTSGYSSDESKPKLDYLIGIQNDLMFLGGTHTVAAINMRDGGKMVWHQTWPQRKSFGRAMLTKECLFVPRKNEIVSYSTIPGDDFGKETGRSKVLLGTGAPVGNLYSDGRSIWVHGANRLYRLEPKDPDAIPDDQPADSNPKKPQNENTLPPGITHQKEKPKDVRLS